MEKTNYSLVKISAGLIFTMFMMLCVLSCDKIDNPIRYGGGSKNPTVQQAVATVINVTGANPSDVTAALDAIVTNEAVAAAAAKGEPIKVTVAGSGVSTDATDQTITIPQANGANIEISFATAPTTSNTNPLEFTASSGAAAASGSATNKLAIEMPTTTGLVITIELPKTTVVLATNGSGAVTYNTITAKTAANTLVVDNDVTIKDLTVKGGNVVIKGGKIDNVTIAENQDVTFTVDGSSMETINIGAGASVGFKRTENHDIYPKIKTVKGDNERTAKFYLPRVKDSDESIERYLADHSGVPEPDYYPYSWTIKGIDKISNVKVLIPEVPANEAPDIKGADFNNVIFDNCEINFGDLYYNLQYLQWPNNNEIIIKDCTFNLGGMGFMAPNLSEDHQTATLEFKNCTFKEGIFIYQFAQWADNVVKDHHYTITFKFTNCKLGDTDLSSSNFVSTDEEHPGLLQPFALTKFNNFVQIEGEDYYIVDVIYQIGETKYVAQVTHEWTEEEQWETKELAEYVAPE